MAGKAKWSDIRKRRLAAPAVKAGYERARRAFELAEEVRRLREERGISQAELARRIGSTQPAIARLEAGGVAPTVETLDRIAAAFDLELAVGFSKKTTRQPRAKQRAKSA